MDFTFAVLLALMAPQVVRIGGAPVNPIGPLTPPQVATYTDPFYTRTARDNKIEGTVTVEASFDAKGNMQVLRTVKSLGSGLDEAALAALRSWKFCPALRNGMPVDSIGEIDILFNIADLPAAEFDDMNHVEPGTSAPTVLKRVQPQYTEEARTARTGGTVVLQAVIQTDGTTKILKIVRPLGFGLTERAIDALLQWTFQPAMRNGQAVAVSSNIEVNFNLEKAAPPSRPACPAR